MPKDREIALRESNVAHAGTLRVATAAKGRRTTIAFLADYVTHFMGAYEAQFRNALVTRCEELDINLLLLYGGAIGHPSSSSAAQNSIFELVHRDGVDGAILLSTSLSSYVGPGKVRELVARLDGLPCCSLGLALDGVPSVIIDNRKSMRAIVEHLIVVHGRRRLAFIGGTPDNPEAQARYAAYVEELANHGLAADPALFANGYFFSRRAREAMLEILSHRVDFDAVVCANDVMAQVVMALLVETGLRVPRDVLVTGFDDVYGAKLMTPPLTTAAQPFDAMTDCALRVLLDSIAGSAVPLVTELEAELVVRRSCGCDLRVHAPKAAESLAAESKAVRHLRESRGQIWSKLRAELGSVPGCETEGPTRLLQALEADLLGEAGAFADALEWIGVVISQFPEHVLSLQRALSSLRDDLRPFWSSSLEDLWQEARDQVELAIARGQLQNRVRLEDGYLRLLECSEEVSRALTRESFRASLSRSLPLLKIQSGAISKFVDGNLGELELMASLVDRELQEDRPIRFSSRHFMPLDTYPDDRRHTSLVLPLVLESRPLGVAVFEYNGESIGQVMVRTQISAALSSMQLHQEVIEKSMQHERSLQERVATTKRMEALSVLAGGVAHDLNNALGPIVALPDVMLAELESTVASGNTAELRRDLETVRSAALRAAQTIKDLLTLGRQGRTAKEPLDLVQLLRAFVGSDLQQIVSGINPRVRLKLELPPSPLIIHASEAHLVRALTNLVHNAAEAICGDGVVEVRARPTHVSNPKPGFETIEPGDYAAITVSDSGLGVPTQDLHRIFEPFFSSKPAAERSGSGLGLAIVHGVVKEHDGFIDVASRPSVGTTFTLYFPKAEAQVLERPRHSISTMRGQGRILIVDDEPIQLRTGKRVLERLGYLVDTFQSGHLACERFLDAAKSGKSPYDLVILDMILNEDFDGLERFEQIRKLFPHQRAIVVSGHAPTERAEAAFEKGLAWLAKPYTAEALAAAVETALAERESLGALRISCKRSSAPPNPSAR